MLSKLAGYKSGEMMIISAGRQTGKSLFSQYVMNDLLKVKPKKFEVVISEPVDGVQWHTVRCNKEVSAWVRTMNKQEWHEHIDQRGYIHDNVFDMSERVYIVLAMKFS